jgi:hypothetical protein
MEVTFLVDPEEKLALIRKNILKSANLAFKDHLRTIMQHLIILKSNSVIRIDQTTKRQIAINVIV